MIDPVIALRICVRSRFRGNPGNVLKMAASTRSWTERHMEEDVPSVYCTGIPGVQVQVYTGTGVLMKL